MLLFRSRLYNHYRILPKKRLIRYNHIHTTRIISQSTVAVEEDVFQDISLDPIETLEETLSEKSTASISQFNKENKIVKPDLNNDIILKFNHIQNDVYQEILNPETTRGVPSTDLPALNDILKGHRQGELTIITGPTGCGKTTIMSQLSLDFCKSGVPTLWGSFEILNKRLAKKMLYQFADKDLSAYPEEIEEWGEKFQKLPLYFLKYFSSTAITDVIEACHYAVEKYNVQHIILDNLQFMLSQQGNSTKDRWELQDRAIHELRNFATGMNVHISLVVHPRKDPGERIDINSVFGSAKVTQEADNVIIVQKEGYNGSKRYLDVQKNRYDGTTGIIPYVFIPESLKIRSYTEEEKTKFKSYSYGSSRSRAIENGSQTSLEIIGKSRR